MKGGVLMPVVLVTAFEAFHDEPVNPTEDVLRALPSVFSGAHIVTATLPVRYGRAFEVLQEACLSHDPDAVIMLGLAKGRTHISLERIAINVASSSIADNAGTIKHEVPLVHDGPPAYFARINIPQTIKALQENNIPAQVSNTAGTYVCNDVFYRLLHAINGAQKPRGVCFVHMPLIPSQVKEDKPLPSLDLVHTVNAVQTIIQVMLDPGEGGCDDE